MSNQTLPSAAGSMFDPASDLMFPLDAQQNSHLPTAPHWDRGTYPPRRAEVARRWNPFGSIHEWPLAVELVNVLRSDSDRTLSLRVTYAYGHDPLLARWRLIFFGWAGGKEEPFDLPGNPALPEAPGQPSPRPVLLEVLNSGWLPTLGAPGRPWETLRHFVLQVEPGFVWHIAAQQCTARRCEEEEGREAIGSEVWVDATAAYHAGREVR